MAVERFNDPFEQGPTVALESHTPNTRGTSWTLITGGTAGSLENKGGSTDNVAPDTVGRITAYFADNTGSDAFFGYDYVVRCTCRLNGTEASAENTGLMVRGENGTSSNTLRGYGFSIANLATTQYKMLLVEWSNTAIDSGSLLASAYDINSWYAGENLWLRFEIVGSRLRAWYHASQNSDPSTMTEVFDVTDTKHGQPGRAGIWCQHYSGGTTNIRWDDFIVEEFISPIPSSPKVVGALEASRSAAMMSRTKAKVWR